MGLDVEFFVPGEDEPIAYLRNHWGFFSHMPSRETGQVYDDADDFWIDHDLLDEFEERFKEHWNEVAASTRTFTEDEAWDILSVHEDRTPDTVRKALYLRLLRRLREAIDEHGPLICAWSA